MPPRGTRRPAARSARADVRTTILDAARGNLERAAFRELSVDTIMERTGLTRTAFYRYFDDLGALVQALMAESTRPLLRASVALADAAREGDEASFRRRLVDLAAVFEEHGVVLDAAVAASHYDEAIERLVEDLRERFVALIAEGLAARAATAGANVEAPVETARALNVMNEAYLLQTFGRGPRVTAEEAAAGLWPVWRQVIFRA